jgi:hypothetical protein
MRLLSVKAFVVLGIALAACVVDTVPIGLRATPSGPGARVVFDVLRRPLPEVPLPNDVATFADPTSRTGRRVNVSVVAPTSMEQAARTSIDELEGWGVYAPVTVSFQKSPLADEHLPALDLDRIRALMPRGDHEFSDDPVYVVNLKTGVPMILDMGSGAQRLTLRDPELYWANDTHAHESNLVYETREEGAGLTQRDYRPELDTDFDGVLDHPNTLGKGGIDGYDNLLYWYERESDTLILRPRLPLEESTEYAVILTDRLVGSDGRPVLSPFEYVHHAQQRDGAARVRDILNDPSRAAYYGDISGSGLDHVAHVWTFTTQPVHEDMEILRNGLYGVGPFARFAKQFPPKVTLFPAAGLSHIGEDSPGWQADPKCAEQAKKPYLFDMGNPNVRDQFGKLLAAVVGGSKRENAALLESLSQIDHVVIGEFDSPYLIGDPKNEGEDDHFQVNMRTGEGQVGRDKVHFWLVVPKETGARKQPFPTAIVGHGYGGNSENIMSLGGEFARQGIASIMIDMPHHGLALEAGQEAIVRSAFLGLCYAPFADAAFTGRATDVGRDGSLAGDSGAWWWTAHLFHVRDNVRQGILDSMQATRIIASFDGEALAEQDYDGDGRPNLAGDFDGNGTVDLAGPITATGGSLGGIVTQILAGVDHQIAASAPIVGGGGMSDIGLRSYGVAESVLQQTLTPLVVALPASERPSTKDERVTTCAESERSVRFIVNFSKDSVEVEIACLKPEELDQGMTVVVTNVKTKEVRCGGTWADGRFRVPIPASTYDRIDVQIYPRANAVTSYGTCEVLPDAPVGRRIQTFERAAPTLKPVADTSCTAEEGCAQFLDRFFPVGSPLVSPQDGLGLRRQSPLFRRFFNLGQAVLDGTDPIAFAPYYALKPLRRPDGSVLPPRPVLNVPSVGDNFVSTSTEVAFGRAAGMVPFLPPDFGDRYPEYREYTTPAKLYADLGGRTPDQILVDGYVTEGISRLNRFPAGPSCSPNDRASDDCPAPRPVDDATCKGALYDADWVSEGALPWDQQHPAIPLRLTRRADVAVTDGPSLDRAWEPRLVGAPFGETGFQPGPPLMSQLHIYSVPGGAHGPDGSACSIWDAKTYMLSVVTRFLATQGRDVLYVTRPKDHRCAEDLSCDFFKQ